MDLTETVHGATPRNKMISATQSPMLKMVNLRVGEVGMKLHLPLPRSQNPPAPTPFKDLMMIVIGAHRVLLPGARHHQHSNQNRKMKIRGTKSLLVPSPHDKMQSNSLRNTP